jgi:hypothetical protein
METAENACQGPAKTMKDVWFDNRRKSRKLQMMTFAYH